MFKSSLGDRKGKTKKTKIRRDERLCTLCEKSAIEDEEHFLLKCTTYSHLREYHQIDMQNVPDLLNMDNQYKLAQFLLSTLEFRQRLIWGRVGE